MKVGFFFVEICVRIGMWDGKPVPYGGIKLFCKKPTLRMACRGGVSPPADDGSLFFVQIRR